MRYSKSAKANQDHIIGSGMRKYQVNIEDFLSTGDFKMFRAAYEVSQDFRSSIRFV